MGFHLSIARKFSELVLWASFNSEELPDESKNNYVGDICVDKPDNVELLRKALYRYGLDIKEPVSLVKAASLGIDVYHVKGDEA